jgi:serine/threonine protein kinase
MPPRLPERYRLNIRLGSDGDIEEWLASDDNLDRPVLIRYLAPESTSERHREFLQGVQSAAALTEIHLQRVFAAGETTASAYSVSEWDGGVTIADRLRMGEGLPVEEFLPNASGLCLALARFHDAGGVHGAIDTAAVHFSAAHPAKLGAFGRAKRWTDPQHDTMALSEVLRAAITGTDDPTVFPSEVIDGIPHGVDTTLRGGIAGSLDARTLATQLSSVSYDAPAEHKPPKPWRTLAIFGLIVCLISLIGAIGLAADFDPDSPFLYPVGAESVAPPATTPVQVEDVDESGELNAAASVYDPFGDGTESDDSLALVSDDDNLTAWSTEAYSRPLREFKDGVGLVFDVAGTPSAMYVSGTPGTTYLVGWAPSIPDSATDWEHAARGTLKESESRIQLPNRTDGLWRLWLTSLVERPDGSFQSRISNVRFVP